MIRPLNGVIAALYLYAPDLPAPRPPEWFIKKLLLGHKIYEVPVARYPYESRV